MNLHNRVFIVTGGNGGIGLALARGVGRAGAQVAIWARSSDRNAEAVEQLATEGIDAFAILCDTTSEDGVERATQATIERTGRIDGVFANAGIASAAPFLDTSLGDWRHVVRTNLDGTFLTTRAVAQRLVEQGEGGSIIVVSSMVSRYGAATQAAYATTKTGLIGLGRSLAVEFARDRIRVNVLIPGWTETGMNATLRQSQKFMDATTSRTPIRRWGQPEDFEGVAAFLADPELIYHTGNEVVVDGGYSIF
ncbi:SDR family NAD(P)-dependent oxidoreductase [Rhodococcus sp. NPDC019627]|uniref:SDR family NAD(P)-dependent oxidoreductase n=1 Tax=unclassified Rhodococcus (in: high G+C Gram-positive bacteria) TaxID=192944 RepID=UPI0034059511